MRSKGFFVVMVGWMDAWMDKIKCVNALTKIYQIRLLTWPLSPRNRKCSQDKKNINKPMARQTIQPTDGRSVSEMRGRNCTRPIVAAQRCVLDSDGI